MRVVVDDAEARARIRTELDDNFVVEAAAGTGKTTILVERLVNLLASGTIGRSDDPRDSGIDRVVAVTFTRKAAGELKLRLREALDRERLEESDPARAARLHDAIARLEEALIGTIHSFCADILRQRPVEAEIDPAFREIDEEETEELFGRAFQGWIEQRLEDMPEALRRSLSRLAVQRSFDGSTPLERLRGAARALLEWRDYPAPWTRRPFDRRARIDACLDEVAQLARIYRDCGDPRDSLRRGLAAAEQLDAWVRTTAAVTAERDDDALEARLIETLHQLRRNARWKGRGSWAAEGLSRADVIRQRDALIDSLGAFRREADADLAPILRAELEQVVERYETLKRSMGRLDFLDLLIRTRDLLRNSPEVRVYLQERYRAIFVDEFQDTDALQVEIIMLLCAADTEETNWRAARPEAGKLFLVGDPKQSIYRFRRADVQLYMDVVRHLREQGARVERLTRSWRSAHEIQDTVNASFAPIMNGDIEAGQPEYVPLDPNDRELPPNQSRVIALPVPRPYGRYSIAKTEIAKSLPDTVAAWVQWLVRDSGWRVEDPESRGDYVPVRARHVAILFRRFKSWGEDMSRPYLQALEARGVPHLLAGGRSFYRREEVGTLLAALTAIEWPDDELSVFATLKGSLFAVRDDALLRFRHEHGSLHPFRRVPDEIRDDEALAPIASALRLLADLHRKRNSRPIADTLQSLLGATRSYAGFAMRPAGNQVLANVQHVCDLARRYEVRGGISFRGFVERLSAEAEQVGSREAPVLEQSAGGVRLLTVHDAKGLEFPVVILADITANLSRAEPSTFLDSEKRLCAQRLLGCAPWELVENFEAEARHEESESDRLTYVAATRARDVLVVPTLGEGEPPRDYWVSPLYEALYPPQDAIRRSEPAPGCPDFGERTVLDRPRPAPAGVEPSVRPGLHQSRAGSPVVWWDPAVLELDAPRNFGLRQERLLRAEPGSDAVATGEADYAAWRERRSAALATGREASLRVVLPSDAEEAPAGPVEITVEWVERDPSRPAGRRFGSLVHSVLKDVPFDGEAATIHELALFHGRQLGAPLPEIDAATEAVRRALLHPRLIAAAAAATTHREIPFVVPIETGAVVEGVIDLVYADGEDWVIVDFKTDEQDDDLADRYRSQLSWYATAVERLTGRPASAVLLGV